MTPFLRITSDASLVDEGAYIDNVRIACRGSSATTTTHRRADRTTSRRAQAAEGGELHVDQRHVDGDAARRGCGGARPVRRPGRFALAGSAGHQERRQAAAEPEPGRPSAAARSNANGAIDASLAIPNQPVVPTAAAATPTRARARKAALRPRVGEPEGRRQHGAARRPRTRPASRPSGRTSPRRGRRGSCGWRARSFRIGSTGRATVRLRLTRRALRQLRRTRRLALRARVVLTNAAGLESTATARLRISAAAPVARRPTLTHPCQGW